MGTKPSNKGGDPFDPFATITSDPSSPDVDPFGASYPAGHSILEPTTDQLVDQNQSIDFFGTIDDSQEQDQPAPDLLNGTVENVNKDLLGDFLDDSTNDMEVQLNGDAQVVMNGEMIVTSSSEMSHVEHSSSSSEVVMETRTETTSSSSSSSEMKPTMMTTGSSSAMISGSSMSMTSGSSQSSTMTSGSTTMTTTEMRSERSEMSTHSVEQSETVYMAQLTEEDQLQNVKVKEVWPPENPAKRMEEREMRRKSSHITEAMMQQVSESSASSSGSVKPAEEKKALDYMKQFYTGEKEKLQGEKIIRAPKKLNIGNIYGKNIESEENKKEVKALPKDQDMVRAYTQVGVDYSKSKYESAIAKEEISAKHGWLITGGSNDLPTTPNGTPVNWQNVEKVAPPEITKSILDKFESGDLETKKIKKINAKDEILAKSRGIANFDTEFLAEFGIDVNAERKKRMKT